jgi:pimeloyl-ACP methyl ester carboxylesterase
MSPKAGRDGRRFFWGQAYTKAENKNGYGYIFGNFVSEYLQAVTDLVQETSREVCAERVVVAGYSMGGFGAYQLGFFAPEIFDAVVSVAGYGRGTLEAMSANSACGGPQPESGNVFRSFLAEEVKSLSAVPAVFVVHASIDAVSSFRDASEIVQAVREHGGSAQLVVVPDEAADSDPKRCRRRSKLGHHYFNYALLHDTSEDVIWASLRRALVEGPCRLELEEEQPEQREQPEQPEWPEQSSTQCNSKPLYKARPQSGKQQQM